MNQSVSAFLGAWCPSTLLKGAAVNRTGLGFTKKDLVVALVCFSAWSIIWFGFDSVPKDPLFCIPYPGNQYTGAIFCFSLPLIWCAPNPFFAWFTALEFRFALMHLFSIEVV
jgi:hypothetical protein